MIAFIRKTTHSATKWAALLIALAVTATSLLQIANIKPVFASYTNTYPWGSAPCADSGSVLGQISGTGYWCSGYNWGENPCPSGDGFCTSGNRMNNYYLYDQWGEGFRNCTSYAAWILNQVFGVNTTSSRSGGWQNGADWNNNALAAGYTDDTSPQIGDIAQWDATQQNSFGHVAYVYNVVNGVASYAEFNYAQDGNYLDTYTSASGSQGAPTHWIHIGTVPPAVNYTNWSGNFSSTWSNSRLDVFTPETWSSGTAYTDHIWYNGSWQAWDAPLSLGSQISSWPSAVSWGSGRIDVFARDPSGPLTQAYYTSTDGWHNWYTGPFVGSCIVGASGVSSWGTNRLDVFAQGCNDNGNHLYHWYFDGTSWHTEGTNGTLPITGQLTSAPAATSWGSSRIDVFARGPNGILEQAYFDGTSWHGWTTDPFGGTCIKGAPGVTSWGTNRLDVFAQGCTDSHVFHWYFDGTSWHIEGTTGVLPNSIQITSSPSASATWGSHVINLYARDTSGHLEETYYNDTDGWHTWVSHGGTLGN